MSQSYDINALLRQTIELARQTMHANEGGPFGAIVTRDGAIISQSGNRVIAKPDPTAHAEVEAIRAASQHLNTFNLSGCELWSSCQPCPMCLGAIYWARIDHVYYAAAHSDAAQVGFDDKWIYHELAKSEPERTLKMEQHLRDEGEALFQEWAQKSDKQTY